VREREHRLRQPEPVEEVEGDGVEGVPAEAAVEVPLLLKHGDGHAAPRERKREERARGAAPHHHALGALGSGRQRPGAHARSRRR